MTLFWIVLGFAALRWLITFANLVTWPVLKTESGFTEKGETSLSVLIPARNEAGNLPGLLAQLTRLPYPHLEILVLDDESEDGTAAVVLEWAGKDSRIRLLHGNPLPEDWLGKPWACHQLGQAASGDLLLFLDADIARIHPSLIDSLKAEVRKRPVALLSVFPRQIMLTVGEYAVVPNLNELLLSILPISLIRRSRLSALSAANGQCMLFDGDIYRRERWHSQVRHTIIEDIAIMKQVKRSGYTGNTLLGGRMIACRMYRNLREGVEGFSKNMLSGFGGSVPALMVYLLLISVGWVLPWRVVPWQLDLIGMALILSRRIMTSLLSRQSVVLNLLLHPAQIALMVYIGARSVIFTYSGSLTWKGRNVV